jgi:thiosulfate/3-mercaptopyruvate sulfurtransferase
MGRQILISVHELQLLQQQSECIVFDCRFVLDDPDAGYESYLESHIPGGVYAHLDKDLASEISSTSGRHPLPDKDQFAVFLASSGWRPGQLLVAYDDAGGAIAARLWWLMKYFGHDHAALLDGGIPAWWAAGFELESGQPVLAAQASVSLESDDDLVLSTTDVINALQQEQIVLTDARAAERFAGKVEPIDKVAGHVPAAVNHPFNLNLKVDGTFKSAEDIGTGLTSTINPHQSRELVHMCGSGVTACHNLFAAELAGLGSSRLYVGSWSEWIRDPSRPITGEFIS